MNQAVVTSHRLSSSEIQIEASKEKSKELEVMYIFRGFCGVHSWQNGTRCRDGGKYCGSFPSSLVGF